jgi:hypothetical protein
MSEIAFNLPTETGSTEMTRFNALRHGVLSRYTVLPWRMQRSTALFPPHWRPSTLHKVRPRSI